MASAMIIRAILIATVASFTLAVAPPARCQSTAPRADHHQHLQSANDVELANSALPPIAVPADIARLLRKREQRWNQPRALEELFTESSQVFTGGNPGWAQGAQRSAEHLSQRFAQPYLLTPTAAH